MADWGPASYSLLLWVADWALLIICLHVKNIITLDPKRKSAPLGILQWVQCFTRMAATRNPGMVPELVAYLIVMVRCVRDFEGLAWAQYDRAFRQRMARTKEW